MPTPTARSWIITPATRTTRFATARTAGAGVVLADLEDSVAAQDKDRARTCAPDFFTPPHPAWCTLGIRINAPHTRDGLKDLTAITAYPHPPTVVLVPKTESPRDIELVAAVLDTAEYRPQVWALIETPRAFERLPHIMSAPRLAGVVFGAADYAAAVGCQMTWEALLHARATLVNSACAAHLPAIDAPVFDLNDTELLRAECHQAKALGFSGKGALHPRQTALINQTFTPSPTEIARAQAIVDAARSSKDTFTTVDGQMVGTPFFRAAQALLDEAPR
ncbi:citrate lyase subunit beta [Streptomyces spiroverticillatus]|uniref:Citrate lyase subunit beta n=1 Tax=Streptomyces finlayi TaxID=67296 RepID=A0A919CGJ7_9ACTN|nr:CoA ester lyase [Streptomyces finlayi]GHA50933.1 citrate lyase subunit beta [Streptomyces spiroverticillatus]GHD20030.1 citrate lyase subunit beta [Streptomyces finlayi]